MNRELDKKIAELKGCNTKLEESTKQWYCDCEHQVHGYSKYDYTPPYLKLYSSKIEDAFPLFEEMQPWVCIEKRIEDWIVYKDHDPGEIQEVGLTAPEAICLAWIKWKESSNESN